MCTGTRRRKSMYRPIMLTRHRASERLEQSDSGTGAMSNGGSAALSRP